ncbi:AAA family ATPase [Caldithrix abyssi]
MKRIFIAATGRNIGKTSVSIGIISFLLRKGYKVGYIKPISQRFVKIGDRKIAPDAFLMKKNFSLLGDLADMSPFVIEPDDTAQYLMGKKKFPQKKILKACKNIEKENDIVIIEGTGHAGVGSVFNLSNAQVAKLLNAAVIIVDTGGIGSAIDRIKLNASLFSAEGCDLLGIMLNKVLKEKHKKINYFIKRWCEQNNLSLFCALPHDAALPTPILSHVKNELHLDLLSEGDSIDTSALTQQIDKIVVATSEDHILNNNFSDSSQNVFIITSSDRTDVILSSLLLYQNGKKNIIGLALSGPAPKKTLGEMIAKSGLPVFLSQMDIYSLTLSIKNLTIKLAPEDKIKINTLTKLFMEYADTESFLRAVSGDLVTKVGWKERVKVRLTKLKNLFMRR